MSAMRVLELSDFDEGRYRSFCDGLPNALIYHSWEYRRLLLEMMDCEAVYLGVEDEAGDLHAVLPSMRMRGSWGTVYNSLPFFGSHGGILGKSEAATLLVRQAYAELTSAQGVLASTVVSNPLGDRDDQFPHDFVEHRVGQLTSLLGADNPEGVFSRISSSARYDVRLSQRSGITVSVENDAFATLRQWHHQRMEEIGAPIKPDAFFTRLPKIFRAGEQYVLYGARKDGMLVALILLLYAGAVVEYFVPVVDAEYRKFQPTAAILFEAMQDAARRGFQYWNWGGTRSSLTGVLRFKHNWGGVDTPYSYYTKVYDKEVLTATSDALLTSYPAFFVVPFSQLISSK